MVNLTFGEQVKILLSRKGRTIKELAEQMEAYTGKSMSRQNMTQRLHRDNFQEQDMRLIAKILGCQFQLSIMEAAEETEEIELPMKKVVEPVEEPVVEVAVEEPVVEEISAVPAELEEDINSREITLEELVDLTEPEEVEEEKPVPSFAAVKERDEERGLLRKGLKGYFGKKQESVENVEKTEEPVVIGDINPYTGKEYQSNSVRMHPKRIGYVQVYDQEQHKWTDMTEWAFLGYQERKKLLLGKDYVPPIYLD